MVSEPVSPHLQLKPSFWSRMRQMVLGNMLSLEPSQSTVTKPVSPHFSTDTIALNWNPTDGLRASFTSFTTETIVLESNASDGLRKHVVAGTKSINGNQASFSSFLN